MTHPSSVALEAHALGEDCRDVAAHLAECAACVAFVERVRGALEKPVAREVVVARVARAAAAREGKTRPWQGATVVALPLAIAAIILLFVRPEPPPPPKPVLVSTAEPIGEPETTFKGGIVVAVVRDRDGRQARFTDRVGVRPNDRLRVEVALDREQAILVAVLGADDSWLELMSEGTRPPGTHFSNRAARVDDTPLRGTILVGAPDAVRRARRTKRFAGVATMSIEWEQP